MNFYFCELCGVRITEKDIAAGQGKDKKLRGVYCTSCAIGVSTVNTVPMDPEQAREILKKKPRVPSEIPARSSTRVPRKSSGIRRVQSHKERDIETSTTPSTGLKLGGWLGGAVGLAFVGATVVFLFMGNPSSILKKNTTRKIKQRKASRTSTSPASKTVAATPISPAKSKIASKVRPAALKKVEVPLLKKPMTVVNQKDSSGKVQLLSQKPVSDLSQNRSDAAKNEPVKPVAPEQVAPPKPEAEPYQVRFDKYLVALFSILSAGEMTDAERVSKKMESDKDLGAWRVAGAEMVSIIAILEKEKERVKTALKKWVGRTVRIETKKERMNVMVLSIENEVLLVEKQFKINGKVKGGVRSKVALKDLKVASRNRLVPSGEPSEASEWVALALLALSKGQLDEADKALMQSDGAELVQPLKWKLATLRWQAREGAAELNWQALVALMEVVLDDERAKVALAKVRAYEKNFEGTTYAWNTRVDRAAYVARLIEIAAALDKRLAELFKGQVKAVNAKKGTISLAYDFSTKEQLKDFVIFRHAGSYDTFSFKPGRLTFRCAQIKNLIFTLPSFSSTDVKVSISYSDGNWKKDVKKWMGIWCGLPETPDGARHVYGDKASVIFRGTQSAVELQVKKNRKSSKLQSSPGKLLKSGTLVLEAKNGQIRVLQDGKCVLEGVHPDAQRSNGIGFGGGWGFSYRVLKIEVSGKLDKQWLEQHLGAQVLPKR